MQKGSLNKVLLIGHLGADPESRFTTSGSAVTNFSLATNESWKAAEGDIKDKTEWHKVVIFGKRAETAAEYMKKGQLVFIEGRLQTRSWEDKDQVKRYTTEILCDNFTMLGRKGEDGGTGSVQTDSDQEDDLPF
ncbi:MAG: single-stranded DNA-binding protein [Planctomycetia bacterium]|nr:single-stranded DNA-binding protein [Planctomycetia bacterium]